MFSPNRMTWGALLGVFATPLVLAGYWQIHRGLVVANESLALTTMLLFGIASVVGAFVHGTFYYMREYVRALNKVDAASQPVIADMLARHRKVLIITYGPVLVIVISAFILFSTLVAWGKPHSPMWMASVNPVTLTIAWLLIRRIL